MQCETAQTLPQYPWETARFTFCKQTPETTSSKRASSAISCMLELFHADWGARRWHQLFNWDTDLSQCFLFLLSQEIMTNPEACTVDQALFKGKQEKGLSYEVWGGVSLLGGMSDHGKMIKTHGSHLELRQRLSCVPPFPGLHWPRNKAADDWHWDVQGETYHHLHF